jgi:hypothetical protein
MHEATTLCQGVALLTANHPHHGDSCVNTFAGSNRAAHYCVKCWVGHGIDLARLGIGLIFWYHSAAVQGRRVLIERLKELGKNCSHHSKKEGGGPFSTVVSPNGFLPYRRDARFITCLPLTVLIIWCVVAAFAIAMFASH